MTSFERLLKVLGDADVKFVVIGGVAIVAHGSSYMTRDLDICYERSPANLERLASALKPHHLRLRDVPESIPFVLDAKTLSTGINFTLNTDLGDLDLMGEVAGVGQYSAVASTALTGEIDGQPCQIASLEVLIASKRAVNRPKDRLVIPELEALQEIEMALKRMNKKA